ncbi:AI-2E family transporter [Escherichia coli]
MLLEVPQLPGKFQQMMARPVEGMAAIQRAIDSVSHYLVLKTAISIITGLVAWAMLAALDVRFAFVWGLLAFALNYIPNIGSVLAAIPPIAQVLVFNGFYEALLVLAGYLLELIWSSAIFWSHASWGVGWDFPHWWYFCR